MYGFRRISAFLLALVLLMGTLATVAEVSPTYNPGTYEATIKGYGGDVKVVMSFSEAAILSVEISGEDETPAIGGHALSSLDEAIPAAQSPQVDIVTGATVTSDAVLAAARQCVEQANLVKRGSAQTRDGSYIGQAAGHNGQVIVRVTISDGQITDLEELRSNEQLTIGTGAFRHVRQFILDNQSLAVDTVAGATVSGNAYTTAAANALALAGADVDALKAKVVATPAAQQQFWETQVLVIGAGIAGLSTAIEAADLGADVILLEKKAVVGGTAARSEGIIQAAGTPDQKAIGVEDTVEAFYQDMRSVQTSDAIEDDMVKKVTNHSTETIAWLKAQGVQIEKVVPIHFLPPRNVARGHYAVGKGGGLTEMLEQRMLSLPNIKLSLETPATELILEDGAVVGAKATNPNGDEITIRAQAVVLTTGGYTILKR